jgi:HD superfamily phosphodiesterase
LKITPCPFTATTALRIGQECLKTGLKLAEATGANVEVVSLFAVFHDSRRINECTDHDHGLRGADFAAELRGSVFDVSMIMNSTCCIVPAKGIRTNGLILTSRFRPAGTQIDLILAELGSRRIQVNFVLMWRKQKDDSVG